MKHGGSGLIDRGKGFIGTRCPTRNTGEGKGVQFKLPSRISVALDSNETRTTQCPAFCFVQLLINCFQMCCSDSNEGLGRQNDISASAF